MADISGGILVGALWLVREIVGLGLQRIAARVGRVGYVHDNAELVERVVAEDGSWHDTTFVPNYPVGNPRVVYAKYLGHLYNDADTPVVLRGPHITYWGVDGPRINHLNPECVVDGTPSVVVTVPAHGTCSISLTATLFVDQLGQHYFGTIPVLSFATVDNRVMEFALRAGSPVRAEEPMVGWDAKNRRAVAAGTREWIRARGTDARVGRLRRSRP